MNESQDKDINTLDDYSRKTLAYFVNLEEEEYKDLVERIKKLHDWITNARSLKTPL